MLGRRVKHAQFKEAIFKVFLRIEVAKRSDAFWQLNGEGGKTEGEID